MDSRSCIYTLRCLYVRIDPPTHTPVHTGKTTIIEEDGAANLGGREGTCGKRLGEKRAKK